MKAIDLMECPYCLSVWVAAATTTAAAFFTSTPLPVITWLAVSGATMLVWAITER